MKKQVKNATKVPKTLDFIGFVVYYIEKVVESGWKYHDCGAKWWIS